MQIPAMKNNTASAVSPAVKDNFGCVFAVDSGGCSIAGGQTRTWCFADGKENRYCENDRR